MTTTTSTTQLNSVNIEAVASLVGAIQAEPSKADTTWQAGVAWQGGFQTATGIREFDPYPTDEPTTLGGSDEAPNPVEQVLGALGSCLAIGYAANATVAGLEIRDLRIDVEGDLDLHTFLGLADGNAGYSDIRVTVHIDVDADSEAIAELHRKVVATSPVGHTLTRAVPVAVDLA